MSGRTGSKTAAFTLVEVIVASAILVTMLGFLLLVMDQSARIWSSTSAKVEQFREARTGFERVTTRLSQATLNTYWDYDHPTVPTRYERRSELRFVSGQAATLLGNHGGATRVTHAFFFNAPLGITGDVNYRDLANGLNTLGFFVELADDSGQRPPFLTAEMIPARWRFRLMEYSQPTESFSLYQSTSGLTGNLPKSASYKGTEWFKADLNSATSAARKRVIAENVIALIITPRLAKAEELPLQSNATHSPLAPLYSYDSTSTNTDAQLNPKNQLPPVVQLTMIALDEKSVGKLGLDPATGDIFGMTKARLFEDTKKLASDLGSLEGVLAAKGLRYRIFTTNVHIRAAKWSREQKN